MCIHLKSLVWRPGREVERKIEFDQWFSTGVNFALLGTFGNILETFLVVTTDRCYWYLMDGEPTDAAKHPKMHSPPQQGII